MESTIDNHFIHQPQYFCLVELTDLASAFICNKLSKYLMQTLQISNHTVMFSLVDYLFMSSKAGS